MDWEFDSHFADRSDDNDDTALSPHRREPHMPDGSWGPLIEQSCNEFLVWVGFGTLVGLAAKAIMPGRDPGGAIATLLMGIAGCVIGCGTLFFFYEGAKVTPISPMGFAAGTAGAFVLLLFYRLLAGSFFVEAEDGERTISRSHRRRRRRTLLRDS
jgi:uncharacterized membrane protein YeaQ/YmgE (transglycosylase-associated protein family)